MKWLGRAGTAVVALVILGGLGWWLYGRRDGAGRTRASVELNRPAATVWEWVHSPAKAKLWVSGVVDIRSETPGATGVGAKEIWVIQDPNVPTERIELQSEVVALDPPRSAKVKVAVENIFVGLVEYRLVPLGADRCRLEYDSRTEYLQWLAMLAEPVVTREAQSKIEGDLARLKQLVEK
jgi:carbon monoxide dehydrogenase subunit G